MLMRDELQLWENLGDSQVREKINNIGHLAKPQTVKALCVKSALEEEFWERSEKLYKKCQKAYMKVDKTIDAVLKSIPPRAGEKELTRDWTAVLDLQKRELGSPLKAGYLPRLFKGVELSEEVATGIKDSTKAQADIQFCATKLGREADALNGHIQQMGAEFDPALFRKICAETQCVSFLLHLLSDLHDFLHMSQLRFGELDKGLFNKCKAGTSLDRMSVLASDKLIFTKDWFDRIVAGKVTEKMLECPSYIR